MNFPPNPQLGESHPIGTKTWYWDGTVWNLLPPTGTGIGNGDSVPAHTHDTPKILDDLLDVEVKEPAFSDTFGYYINTASSSTEDPDALNGWGRYFASESDKKLTLNKKDLDGKSLDTIYDSITDVTTCRFKAVDNSYDLEAKVVAKTKTTTSVTLTFNDTEALEALHNDGKSKLFQVLFADYKALSDGAILVYRRQRELWGPEPSPTLETGNRITLSYNEPTFPNNGDVWVDEGNFYMYLWDGEMWVALTGPESGNGGGDIANNKEISLVSSRGLVFNDSQIGAQFRLNQTFDQQINIKQKNITTYAYERPEAGIAVGDIWINKTNMHQYVWDGDYWIGLTGDNSYFPATSNRLEQPCRLIGGKPDSVFCYDGDGANYIPSPVYISPTPPVEPPKPGDLWFDSEHLELRVWYASPTSYAGWVSSTHPGMRPDLAKAPNPDPITLTGPPVAQELTESNRYVATISWKILEDIEKAGGKPPIVEWYTNPPNSADFIYKDEPDHTIATAKFGKFGNYTVFARIKYYDDPSNPVDPPKMAEAFVDTNVGLKPVGDPIRYVVRVVDGGSKGLIYEIDGNRQPPLNLQRNRKYIFDQSHPSNDGYPIRFYDALVYNGAGEITDIIEDEYVKGVEQLRKDVHFSVPSDAPIRLRYGSPTQADYPDGDPDRKEMGWWIYPYDADGQMNLVDPAGP